MRHTKALQSNKMIWVMIIPLVIIMSLSSVSSRECYQEWANQSTACGGLATGWYYQTGYDFNYYNWRDGDYTTDTTGNLVLGGNDYSITNYTKITNLGAKLQFRAGNSVGTTNTTIPSVCWNTNSNRVSIKTTSNKINPAPLYESYILCEMPGGYNYAFVHDVGGSVFDASIYEEGIFWFTQFLENNISYINTTYETQRNSFTINITYDDLNYNYANAILYYNNTAYSTNKIGNSTNLLFTTNNVTAPNVNNSINISFFWQITLINSSLGYEYYNTTSYNQTVLPLTPLSVSTGCSGGLNTTWIFNFSDEGNFTNLNASVKYVITTDERTINGSITNTNGFVICMNISQPDYYIRYGEIQYQSTGYSSRRFYIFNNTRLTNVTAQTTLYDLINGDATSFLFTMKDTSLNPYVNYYVGLLRWYPQINEYKLVEYGKTDDKGETVLRVKTEDVDYRVALYSTDGTLINLANPIRMVCQVDPCTYSMSIETQDYDFTGALKTQDTLVFDNDTKIFTYTWNDPTQSNPTMNLSIIKYGALTNTIVCSTTGTGSTGIILCDISPYGSGTYKAIITRTASPTTIIKSLMAEIRSSLISVNANGKTIGLLLAGIFALLGFMVGLISPILAIIFGVIALVPALYLGSVNLIIIIPLAVIGGVIIHFMRKEQ